MAKKKKATDRVWIDGQGQEVPEKYVPAQDRRRDELVAGLVNRARRLNIIIANEKAIMSRTIANHLEEIAAERGVEWEGGTTLYNFSMTEAVTVKVAKRFTFDENLNLAKLKIDECIRSWSPGSNDKIVALVMNAFNVDSRGEVDAKQIIGLRRYNFTDPPWLEAMELIATAQKVLETKTYFYFQEAGEDGKLRSIVLDFAAL
ncbi:MAG: DUF3164 family protein [Candidatus Cloacimonetes bacterium]|jgi:hypothetical protein|nr:DUF3164 family protein [Candidatus Cloacimonadota bacterium]MCB5287493.1 DUF3164 family protein [Candidatus Cloacimonadota bacterium]MCK9185258.1 DUF3164 family protein [Candidatus Cloacimonadota bacterium]MDY0229814.1 DUF3164 family protein [Candidatus Cloacimonadaceae bacterium]